MLREYRTLLPYFRRYLPQYLAGLFFLVITDGGQLYIPQLIRQAIDIVSQGQFALEGILRLALRTALVGLVIAAGRFSWRFFINGTSRRIEQELRERLFQHLQTLSTTFFASAKTGDLMARFTNDMRAIRMATGMALVSFVDGFFMTLAILAIMLSQDARLTLISVSPLPLVTVGMILFGRIVGKMFRRVQEGFSNLSEMAQESVSGVRVLKTFVQERAFVGRFGEVNLDYSRRNLVLVRAWGAFFPGVSFLAGTTTLIFLYLGGRAVMDGTLSPGQFTAFFSYLGMLIWPVMGAGFTINLIQRAGASLGRINKILDQEPDIKNPPQPVRRPIRGAISVRGLTYAYPGSEAPVLQGIGFEASPGTVLGILGRTGSGKSTLVHLLPRILDPPPGTVFIDGHDVRRYRLETLRSAISVVPQDGFLFSVSIRDNIAFGGRNGEDGLEELVRQVTSISTIDRDLSAFPEGVDTVVGERGITLSGGQKQRVAMSRALASKGRIYIFDDSFAAVDTETEESILRALFPYIEGSTVILISHRISTLKMADRVLVLDSGRLIEEGTHEELLARGGFYAEIFELQQLEDSMEERR